MKESSCTPRAGLMAVLIMLCLGTVASVSRAPEGGEAFTAATSVVDMGEAWRKQPIRYDEAWAKDTDLAITLDQHLYPALSPLINRFSRERGVRIVSQEGTCGISAGLVAKKRVDIGGYCCPPGTTDRLPGLQYHTLGISALGILVNALNPVTDLDVKTIRDLFRGEIQHWSQLPAADPAAGFMEPVRVLARFHCKQRPGHWRLILDNEELFSLRTEEVGSIEDMIANIAALPGAIGYEVLWNIARHQATGKVKYLRVGGADPTRAADVASGNYPFYRVYNISTWRQGSGMENTVASDLVRYLMTHLDEVKPEFSLVPADTLRQAGWKFDRDELVGGPEGRAR